MLRKRLDYQTLMFELIKDKIGEGEQLKCMGNLELSPLPFNH